MRVSSQHTVVGERILSAAPALRTIGKLVRSSHERWDGTGYPDALAGEEIPLGARIIAVCDAFDAMTDDRPYQPAVPLDEALAELRRCAGTQFDPTVVEVFCEEAEAVLRDVEQTSSPPRIPGSTPMVLRVPAEERRARSGRRELTGLELRARLARERAARGAHLDRVADQLLDLRPRLLPPGRSPRPLRSPCRSSGDDVHRP